MSSVMASGRAASVGFTSGRCDICGKLLKSSNPEAMAAHQRESSSCVPAPSKGNAPKAVKDAEARLAEVIEEGRKLQTAGSLAEQERNAEERKQAEQALKRVRAESKSEKRQIKELAAASMSTAAWTSSLTSALDGGGNDRFSRAEDNLEHRLAQQTVGLVKAEDFRRKREAIEEEEAGKADKAEREEEARRDKLAAKRAKRQQQERMKLSFADDE